MSQIAYIGDLHGNFEALSLLMKKVSDESSVKTFIQVGDFGYWPRRGKINEGIESIEVTENCKLFWIDGNHEDFESMKNFGMLHQPGQLKVWKNGQINYVPRGTILNIYGKNILFIGGAESIDAAGRTEHLDWFREESITQRDIENALSAIEEFPDAIDVVVSHECPASFDLPKILQHNWEMFGWKSWPPPSRIALQAILEVVSPKLWMFGHYHESMQGQVNETEWHCLKIEEVFVI
ncbi:MAG: Metallophosphoesterase [Candidatus Woesebacteria bacterium GW2011_GWB1_39_12]|uniref:Metallophosphoesterase n=1 Tax=Candidatus Woesebacteria bacterium GW2011_GWB1_39_12 TaxID=1618574 RepID=A0A0G0PP85_9BACT|nr:MAG: Metallophosphoesterase [Candidatus Woesebacteria bacterium GW2011_GWB1_39_12]